MRRVAEIIHIVEDEREAFLKGALNPDEEAQKVLWMCGVRNQIYFALNELIFMTFEYHGDDFASDMKKMAAFLESKGQLVSLRRRDVASDLRGSTNWWAPVKRLGALLTQSPFDGDGKSWDDDYMAMLDGCMEDNDSYNDISFDENDWSDDIII